jgi:hypothetical protein
MVKIASRNMDEPDGLGKARVFNWTLMGQICPYIINLESVFFLDLILQHRYASSLSAARTFLPISNALTSPSHLILSCKIP